MSRVIDFGLSVGIGVGVFLALGLAFALFGYAYAPGEMYFLHHLIIRTTVVLLPLYLGPVEGLLVGVIAGLRHRGSLGWGAAAGFTASLLGFTLMIILSTALFTHGIRGFLGEWPRGTIPSLVIDDWRRLAALLAPTALIAAVGGCVSSGLSHR